MNIRMCHLADAFLAVARVNHYMVGIIESCSAEELEGAKQILIARQNAGPQSGMVFREFDLALDLLDVAIEKANS